MAVATFQVHIETLSFSTSHLCKRFTVKAFITDEGLLKCETLEVLKFKMDTGSVDLYLQHNAVTLTGQTESM